MSALQINLDEDPFAQFNDPQFQDQANADAQQAAQAILITLGIFVGIFIFSIVAMCMYKTNVHDNKPAISENNQTMSSGNFHYGLFDCFTNMNECLCSCFCTSVRFADTYSSVGLGGFWCCWFQFWGLNVIASFIVRTAVMAAYPPPADPNELIAYIQNENEIENIVGILVRGLIFGVWCRGKLRKRLGDNTDNKMNTVIDLLAWGACPCCALTQESVEVDIAADVSISCPWTLTKGRVRAREVAPSDYQSLLGDAQVVLEEGR